MIFTYEKGESFMSSQSGGNGGTGLFTIVIGVFLALVLFAFIG